MKSNLAALVVCALALGLGVAACGDDDEISKADFVKQGSEICQEGGREIAKSAREEFGRGAPSDAALRKFAPSTLVPAVQSQIDQIRDLGAPPGDEEEVDAILAEAEAALRKTEADPTLLASPGTNPFAKADGLLIRYGLEACAN